MTDNELRLLQSAQVNLPWAIMGSYYWFPGSLTSS
jgi:hypothetical protein